MEDIKKQIARLKISKKKKDILIRLLNKVKRMVGESADERQA